MMKPHLQHCMLGNEDHDRVHAHVFDCVAEIASLVRNQQPHADQVHHLRLMLDEHFRYENDHLAQIKCPKYAAHVRDHARLLDHLDKIMQQKEIGTSLAYSVTVLENMFADHISYYDRAMVIHERQLTQ